MRINKDQFRIQSRVAVIILNWNGVQDTIECVQSLRDQNYDNVEIVVVDNGSTDDSVKILRNLFHDKIAVLANDANLGFSGGNNRGIEYALVQESDYVMLLNNDTIVTDQHLISTLVDTFEIDNKIGLACPTIYYASPSYKPWYAGAKYNLWFGGGRHIQQLPENDEIVDTGYVTGCCVMVSKEILNQVGLLDEDYFLYQEDVDWSLRVKRAGSRVVYVPSASIIHKVSASTRASEGQGTYSPTTIYYKYRNCILLVRKHGNFFQKYLLWPLYTGWDVIYHGLAYLLLGRWQKLIAMFRGVVAGLQFDLKTH